MNIDSDTAVIYESEVKEDETLVNDNDHNVNINVSTFKVPPLPKTISAEESVVVPHNQPLLDTSQNKFELSPAEQLAQINTPIPYKEPAWGGLCEKQYSFEVLKTGSIIHNIDLRTKSYYVFGRLQSCDIQMEHPSLSRYHAIIQFCAKENDRHEIGWYLFDLDSTHGTWINKIRIKPRIYYRIRVGHVLKFGGSSRLYVVQGPEEDREPESELGVAELKEQRERQKREAELLKEADKEAHRERHIQQLGGTDDCSWGMSEDAVDHEMLNPFADVLPQNEHVYANDPKKALNNYFEREGLDLPEYDVTEDGRGKYRCRIELPVQGPSGEQVIAEALVSGKKRDAVLACALEACRILDRYGELCKANTEGQAKKRKKNWEEEDFYESDEDVYLDRTGAIEKKRHLRMKLVGKADKKVETYESLNEQLTEVTQKIDSLDSQLEKAKQDAAGLDAGDIDALDAYMSAIKSGAVDARTRTRLKVELMGLRKEKLRLEKLVLIARPVDMPQILQKKAAPAKAAIITGRMKGPGRIGKPAYLMVPKVPIQVSALDSEEEEEETDCASSAGLLAQPDHLAKSSCMTHEGDESLQWTGSQPQTIETKSHSSSGQSSDTTTGVQQMDTEELDKSCTEPKKLSDHKNVDLLVKPRLKSEEKVVTMELISDHDIANKTNGESTNNSSSRLLAPSLQSTDATESKPLPAKADLTTIGEQLSVKSRQRTRVRRTKKVTEEDFADEDPEFAAWLPPPDQTGDGRTSLNEKLGY